MSFGDPNQLRNRYGSLKTSTRSFAIPTTSININAPFQKRDASITLPSFPLLQIKPIQVEEVVQEKEDKLMELLQFIDANKLVKGRAGGKTKTYSLNDLIRLSSLLNLPKSQNKGENIENIKTVLVKNFGDQPNLIGQLNKDKFTINEIKSLMEENLISEEITDRIIKKLKSKHGNNIPSDNIVEVLELQWLK